MRSNFQFFVLLAVIHTAELFGGYENEYSEWMNAGQQSHQCPYHPSNWPHCNPLSNYRNIDGSCNNIFNPLWGRASTPFERFIPPSYADGVLQPRLFSVSGKPLPNARIISREFHVPFSNLWLGFNQFSVAYAQFISHDVNMNSITQGHVPGTQAPDCCTNPHRELYIERNTLKNTGSVKDACMIDPECLEIPIPPHDPAFSPNRTCINFVRAISSPNDMKCNTGLREQVNRNTHYLDGSPVYGSALATTATLRAFFGGFLETNGDLLPPIIRPTPQCIQSNPHQSCFRSGDDRVNQQPALASIHTLWMREHNRIAMLLAKVNPIWKDNDELLFQETRRIVVAMMQHIVYNEYLPIILGHAVMEKYGLIPKTKEYFTGYDPSVKPMIRNVFSTAAFRFCHSMISGVFATHNGFEYTYKCPLHEVFFKPDAVYKKGITEILRGETRLPSENVDRFVSPQLTRFLFEVNHGDGQDLIATDIQRGRDHGISGYQTWRRFCGLHGYHSHDPVTFKALEKLYFSLDDIDLFPAGVSELHVPGGVVGPTFACLIAEQFRLLKQGDRFFYENAGPHSFTLAQLHEIRKVTLSSVMCRNTDAIEIQPQAFREITPDNPLVPCKTLGDIDLSAWRVFSKCELAPGIKAPCLPTVW